MKTAPDDSTVTRRFVQWNNRGADLLERRQCAQAIRFFSSSLGIIQRQIKVKASPSKPSTSSAVSPAGIQSVSEHIFVASKQTQAADCRNSHSHSHRDQQSAATASISESSTATSTGNDFYGSESKPLHHQQEKQKQQLNRLLSQCRSAPDSDGAFLYRHPVRFSPAIAEAAPLTSDVLRPLSVLVVFNMAIAQHLYALEVGQNGHADKQQIKRAIFLYEMALRTQAQKTCLQPLGMDGFQLLLACYNNLGHAQDALLAHKRASLCFQSLLSLLMWAVVHNVISSVSADGFWRSVHPLLSTTPAPAAAA